MRLVVAGRSSAHGDHASADRVVQTGEEIMGLVHPFARTTLRTRTKIKGSSASLTEVAECHNITVATAR